MEITLALNIKKNDIIEALFEAFEAEGFVCEGVVERESTLLYTFIRRSTKDEASSGRARIIVLGEAPYHHDPFDGDWIAGSSENVGDVSDEVNSRPIVCRFEEADIPSFLFPAIVPENERITMCNVIDLRSSLKSATERLWEKLGIRSAAEDIVVAEAMLIQPEWSIGLLHDLAKAEKTTTVNALQEVDPAIPVDIAAALVAITHRDPAALRDCLASDEHGSLVKYRIRGGLSLLHVAACIPGALSLIDILLEYGFSANERSLIGDTPLYYAAWSGKEMAKRLLDCGADPTNISLEGSGILSIAAWLGYNTLAKRALDAGAPAFITDKNCGHPLIWASQAGHARIVELIAERFPGQIDVAAGEYGLGNNDPEFLPDAPNVPPFVQYRRRRIAEGGGLGRTALMSAVMAGRGVMVDLLLSLGADPNRKDNDGQCALHYLTATDAGVTELLCRKLRKAQADIDARDNNGATPLRQAVASNRPDLVKYLLQAGANAEIRDGEGFTPLHLAVSFGTVEIIRALLPTADIEATDRKGYTALHLSIFFEYVPIETVKTLLEAGASPNVKTKNGRGSLSLLLSSERHPKDKSALAALLLEYDAEPWLPDSDGEISLLKAAFDGYSDFGKTVLEKINYAKLSALELNLTLVCSSAVGSLNIVKLVLEQGAQLEYLAPNGFRALAAASLKGHTDIVAYLIEQKAQINSSPEAPTALTCAAEAGCDAIVDLLLATEADPNLPGRDGRTPLFFAIGHGRDSVVKELLDHGAYVGVRSKSGLTPLHIAARNGKEEIGRQLLGAGAYIDARDVDGDTPLHVAVHNEKDGFIRLLIDRGAQINVANDNLVFPIHVAAGNGSIDVAELLVQYRANLNVVDKDRDTPLHYAAMNGHESFVDWLLKKNVEVEALNAEGKRPSDLAKRIAIINKLEASGVGACYARQQESQRASFLNWEEADSAQQQRVKEILHDAEGESIGDIECAELVFYPNCYIAAVSLIDYKIPNQIFYLISRQPELYSELNWKNEPIYNFNDKMGLFVDSEESLKSYVRFFFFFVRGMFGRFRIVETVAEIEWEEGTSAEQKSDVAPKLLQLMVVEDAPPGMRRLRFTCTFKNALFQTDAYLALEAMEVQLPDEDEPESFSLGQMALKHEELLLEDLPIMIPGPPGRFG